MKLKTALESISQILGPEAVVGLSGPSADLFSSTLTSSVRVHQAFRSSSGTGQLPLVVIPEDSNMDDFFATVATYYPNQLPISAYVHVLGKDIKECLDPAEPNIFPDSRGLNRSQLALLGACFGETVFAALGSTEGALSPSYSACKRSLGYALARTVALYPSFEASVTIERWERLRQLTGLSVSQFAMRAIREILAASLNGSKPWERSTLAPQLQSALVNHLSVSDANDVIQNVLLECYPQLDRLAMKINGPFDARMGVFLRLVEEIQRFSQGAETDSLAVGYFCNMILPGSFAHGKVLARIVEFFPSSLIWYGMFCSTSSQFDATHFGSGLFAKLTRDISQPFSFAQRPQCDLSLDELEVLMRVSIKSEAIKPIQQKIASVALLPGLDVFSRFTPDDEGHSGKDSAVINSSVSDERLTKATQLLDEAVSLMYQLGGQERKAPISPSPRRQRKR